MDGKTKYGGKAKEVGMRSGKGQGRMMKDRGNRKRC